MRARWLLVGVAMLAIALALTRELSLAIVLAAAATFVAWLARRAARDPLMLAGVAALPAGLLLVYAGLAECDRADCGGADVLYWLSPLGVVVVGLSLAALVAAVARRRSR